VIVEAVTGQSFDAFAHGLEDSFDWIEHFRRAFGCRRRAVLIHKVRQSPAGHRAAEPTGEGGQLALRIADHIFEARDECRLSPGRHDVEVIHEQVQLMRRGARVVQRDRIRGEIRRVASAMPVRGGQGESADVRFDARGLVATPRGGVQRIANQHGITRVRKSGSQLGQDEEAFGQLECPRRPAFVVDRVQNRPRRAAQVGFDQRGRAVLAFAEFALD